MEYSYSDPHFGHNRPFIVQARGFCSVQEMNETLIRKYNETVSSEDTVYWHGDCFVKAPTDLIISILKQLNGFKICILGNHDQRPGRMLKFGFHGVCSSMVKEIGGYFVNMSHFPYKESYSAVPNKRCLSYDNRWLLCGHVHASWKVKEAFKMINVGVDVNDLRPVDHVKIAGIIQETESRIKRAITYNI
jgi:calcineurin-like phosphoesterase family protein